MLCYAHGVDRSERRKRKMGGKGNEVLDGKPEEGIGQSGEEVRQAEEKAVSRMEPCEPEGSGSPAGEGLPGYEWREEPDVEVPYVPELGYHDSINGRESCCRIGCTGRYEFHEGE